MLANASLNAFSTAKKHSGCPPKAMAGRKQSMCQGRPQNSAWEDTAHTCHGLQMGLRLTPKHSADTSCEDVRPR